MKRTSGEERRQIAREAGCTAYYLYHVVKNGCSPGLAKKIEAATKKFMPDRIVSKAELRPDIWGSDT